MIGRYEDLRRLVLDRHGAQAQGLALFISHGMAGWLQAWSQCIADQAAPGVTPPPASMPSVVAPVVAHDIFPVRLQNDVALLLASMVLATRQEISA